MKNEKCAQHRHFTVCVLQEPKLAWVICDLPITASLQWWISQIKIVRVSCVGNEMEIPHDVVKGQFNTAHLNYSISNSIHLHDSSSNPSAKYVFILQFLMTPEFDCISKSFSTFATYPVFQPGIQLKRGLSLIVCGLLRILTQQDSDSKLGRRYRLPDLTTRKSSPPSWFKEK